MGTDAAAALTDGLLGLAGRLLATIPEGLGAFLAATVVLSLLRVRDPRLRGAVFTLALLDAALPLFGGGWCAALRLEFVAGPGPANGSAAAAGLWLRAAAAAGAAAWIIVAAFRIARSAVRFVRVERFAASLRVLAAQGRAVVIVPGDGVPFTAGVLRPVVVLPAGFRARLTPGEARAALRHEIAHVRRRDTLRAALTGLLEDLLWFHPAVTALGRRASDERESAADERALRHGASSSDLGAAIAAAFTAEPSSGLRTVAALAGRGPAVSQDAVRVARRIERLARPCGMPRCVLQGALLLVVLPFGPGAGRSAVDLTYDGAHGRLSVGLGWCSGPACLFLPGASAR